MSHFLQINLPVKEFVCRELLLPGCCHSTKFLQLTIFTSYINTPLNIEGSLSLEQFKIKYKTIYFVLSLQDPIRKFKH